jgi:hypothetical protein
MPKLPVIAVIAAAELASSNVHAATHEHRARWRIVRTDYVEFCNPHIASIGVADGSLHGAIGNCVPPLDSPAKNVEAHADEVDIVALRKTLSKLKATALTDRSCAAARKSAPTAIIFSGPVTLTIERDGGKVVVDARSPCLTTAGRDLLELVNRTIEPLRRLGLR